MYGIPLRYIAYLVAVLSFVSLGWYAKYEHDHLVSFEAKVQQAAIDQNRQSKLKDEENAKIYSDTVGILNSELIRLRKQLSSSKLPSTAQNPGSTDGAQQELSGACKGSEFYNNALEDALKLQYWQELALKYGWKVGD